MELQNNTIECCICFDNVQQVCAIKCPSHACNFKACKKCFKHFLNDNPMSTKCMECDIFFDHSIMVELFGKSYVTNDLKKQQKTVLFERQLAQMPATQMSQEFKIAKNKKEISELNKAIRNNGYANMELREQLKAEKNVLEEVLFVLETNTINVNSKEENSIVMKCTNQECNGFISTNYICEVCDRHYCNKCIQVIENDVHNCKKEDVDTAKLILSDTKPCPSCGTRISKLSGCDQMWCIQCHTSFSWKTGRIEKGIVHNPHYFEWIRNNGSGTRPLRNPRDIHCGGLRDVGHFEIFTEIKYTFTGTLSDHYYGRYCGKHNEWASTFVLDQKINKITVSFNEFVVNFKDNFKEKNLVVNDNFNKIQEIIDRFYFGQNQYIENLQNQSITDDVIIRSIKLNYYNEYVYTTGNEVIDTISTIIVKLLKDKCTSLNRTKNYTPITKNQKELIDGGKKINCVDNFYNYYLEIAHIIGNIEEKRNTLQILENERYMLDKRINYLLGKTTDKQLSDACIKRDYAIKRQRAMLQLYEVIEIIGVEESETLFQDLTTMQANFIEKMCGVSFINYYKEIHNQFLQKFQIYECAFTENFKPNEDIKNILENYLNQRLSRLEEYTSKIMNALKYYNQQLTTIGYDYKFNIEHELSRIKPKIILPDIH